MELIEDKQKISDLKVTCEKIQRHFIKHCPHTQNLSIADIILQWTVKGGMCIGRSWESVLDTLFVTRLKYMQEILTSALVS
jgi:hypothetical protein